MDTSIGRDRFCEMFEGRAVVIAELPAGRGRVLAHVASQRAGRDDGSLRTTAEYMALFDLLLTYVSPAPLAKLELLDEAGQPPPRGLSRTTSRRRGGSRNSSTRPAGSRPRGRSRRTG